MEIRIEDPEVTAMAEQFGLDLYLAHDAEAPEPWAVWAEVAGEGYDIAGCGSSPREAIEDAIDTLHTWAENEGN